MLIDEKDEVNEWEIELARVIRRKGFHKYFKNYSLLGAGSFAKVYLSKRNFDGKFVATKALSKDIFFENDKRKRAIFNEISILRRLSSPHLVKL